MGADSAVDCIFCRIVSGGIKARIISKSRLAIAFMDAFPLALGHILVIPRTHRHRIQDMTHEETAEVFGMAANLIDRTDQLGGATLLAVHNGQEAGQDIPHTHIHLVPRRSDDGAGPIHSMFPRCEFPQDATDAMYEKLQD